MGVKIKVNLNIRKQLQAAQSLSSRQIKKEIINEIDSNYSKGISPVRGFNVYKAYRESTAKKKGRKTPVTIKESGKLRASLTAVQKKRHSISIFFRGKRNQKLSQYINFGTIFMDARPLLPIARGQTFKKRITDKFNKIVSKSLNRFIK